MKKFFVPEIRGRLVTSFLVNFFSHYLEYGFTSDMEQFLDDVSNNTRSKLDVLNNFWKDFSAAIEKIKDIKISDVIEKLNASMEKFLFSENNKVSRKCPECNEGELSLKIGRFGSFIGCSRYPECNYVRKLDSSPMSQEDSKMLNSSEYPKFLGEDKKDGSEIFLKKGPYGIYLEKKQKNSEEKSKSKDKPVRSSVPKFIDAEKIDMETASFLLHLPKTIGTHENEEIKIGIGRYGPYIFFKGKYVAIPKPEDILTIDSDQAVKILKEKKLA